MDTLAVWQLGCSPESARDSVALSSANSALIHHLGARLATTEDTIRSKLVCTHTIQVKCDQLSGYVGDHVGE